MEIKALGLVEVAGLAPAIETCDIMVKTASVTVVEIENTKGGGYTVIKVEGDVGAVNAACKAGEAYATGIDKLVSVKVIPRPASGTKDFLQKKSLIDRYYTENSEEEESMFMARVIGNVVATRKEESLVGSRFMIIQRLDKNENPIGDECIAADYIGAGKGELVLVGTGSSVRVEDKHAGRPIDMAILGIIDEVQ